MTLGVSGVRTIHVYVHTVPRTRAAFPAATSRMVLDWIFPLRRHDFSFYEMWGMMRRVCIGTQLSMLSHLEKEKQKLIARIKRIRGQVDSIERSLTTDDDCADVLMLLANVRGGINSLMAKVLEDHIRLHTLSDEKSSMPTAELAEDLIGLVRAYLK